MKRKPIYIIIKLKDKLIGHWIEIQIDEKNDSTVWMDGNKVGTDTVVTSIGNPQPANSNSSPMLSKP